MASSISAVLTPSVINMMAALDGLADKAAARCHATGVAEAVYLGWRVAPDMLPLATQFRFATEIPARGLSRLAAADIPSFGDSETSFSEFKDRISRVRMILGQLDVAAIDAEPDAEIRVPAGPRELVMPRHVFAFQWILANMYFHSTAAYLILRGLGVELGKTDFLIGLAPYLPAR